MKIKKKQTMHFFCFVCLFLALILENTTAVITIGNSEFDELMNEIDIESKNDDMSLAVNLESIKSRKP